MIDTSIIFNSAIITIGFYSIIPVIGFLLNQLELLEFKILSMFFGNGFASFFCDRITFIGTVLHELSHALFATLTGAKVTKISIMDFFQGGQLGHVEFVTRGNLIIRSIQLVFASCAPVLVGVFALIMIFPLIKAKDVPMPIRILAIYAFISILNHTSMSGQDLALYMKGIFLVLPLTFFALTIADIFFGFLPKAKDIPDILKKFCQA